MAFKETKFEGPRGNATIKLSRKIPNLPEGMAKTFPLMVEFIKTGSTIKGNYFCWSKVQAKRVAEYLTNGK